MADLTRFTPAYDRARSSVKNKQSTKNWGEFLNEKLSVQSAMMLLLGMDGPNSSHAGRLDNLRDTLKASNAQTEADIILKMVGASGSDALSDEQADAAATLKMLRHFYHVHERGSQSVWIYAQPYSFHKWVFDEIKGCTPTTAKTKLNYVDEVYPQTIRAHMGNGVQQALSWSQKCVAKLGTPDEATQKIIARWFFAGQPAPEAMGKAAATLLEGFKKITNLCNANLLIFSDEPIDRMKGSTVAGQTHYKSNWEDYAFVDGGSTRERLNVVYIQNATLQKWASSDESWMATLAILHELSHRLIETKDAVYDFTGLKPGSVLTNQHAIVNADSWAYFATDLNGQLPNNKLTSVWKEPPALRANYLSAISSAP